MTPPSANKRRRSSHNSPGHSSKRAKRNSDGTASRRGSKQQNVESIDLVDEDNPLADTLQKQRAEQVQAQGAPPTDAPVRLSNLTCVICMDTPKDLTATACGHLFCHTCLMEALIAGENRVNSHGEQRRSQCPVCRKTLSRTKNGDVIPLALKLKNGLATQPRRKRTSVVEV
ncbi:uncharacterized protein K452DRAFT_230424 [Aplosporella prunicola CBS 121167]|uniref:RING-type domain-containing protein n=1 Tax=Aplosporella prunicola CBS 121167 TaxID=1176127 RepID=A0A6A6B987_9PEZI|nr:uncharacterized protein K452DRAFT_230424 [Aplosporella prunicola CBS 121167]KAF2140566.1 hypothetical protein K452DRAFT_230424 [Aplosporella prunicola CBS 121167]